MLSKVGLLQKVSGMERMNYSPPLVVYKAPENKEGDGRKRRGRQPKHGRIQGNQNKKSKVEVISRGYQVNNYENTEEVEIVGFFIRNKRTLRKGYLDSYCRDYARKFLHEEY